jgi:5-carboxymethyl-2-hydroxymuconate isomerase
MPHLRLEYTDNIGTDIHVEELFSALHGILVDVGGIRIENCKSRAILLDDYLIGAGSSEGAFVHLEVRLFEGRSVAVKREMGKRFINLLGEYFETALAESGLQITVQIIEMQKESYFKLSENGQ